MQLYEAVAKMAELVETRYADFLKCYRIEDSPLIKATYIVLCYESAYDELYETGQHEDFRRAFNTMKAQFRDNNHVEITAKLMSEVWNQ
jgi:hypothetical protein